MTDITILTSTNYIEFHFNDLTSLYTLKEDILHKSNVDLSLDSNDMIIIKSFGRVVYKLTFGESNALNVEDVDGVAVTSKTHLFNLIETALGIGV